MNAKEATFVSWVGLYAPGVTIKSFADLADANILIRPLQAAAKICFAGVPLEQEAAGNWILMKTNLVSLMNAMSQFATNYLNAQSDLDLAKQINATLIAKKEGADDLLVLCEHVAALTILANNIDVIAALKTLPKEQQTTLSTSVKRIISLYNLRKATNLPTTTAHVEIAQAARAHAAPSSPSTPAEYLPSDREDSAKLHAEIGVLRNDLRDKSSALHLSESRLEMAESQLQELQLLYRTLLDETQSKGPSMRERELHQAVSNKEHTIQSLNLEVAEMRAKAQRSKVSQEELSDEVDTLKKALEESRSALKTRTEEKQDAMTKLVLAKDQLQVGNRRRDEVEGELIKLREQLAQQMASPKRGERSVNIDNSFGGEGESASMALQAEVEELRRLVAIKDAEMAMVKKMRGTTADPDMDPEALTPEELMRELNDKLETAQRTIKAQEERIQDLLENQKEQMSTFEMKLQMAQETAQASAAGGTSEEWEQLKSEKDKFALESERAKRHLAAAQEEIDTLKSEQLKSEEFRHNVEEARKARAAEQAAISSVVFQVGLRNLALQQRNLLGGTAVPHLLKDEAYTSVFKDSSVQNRRAPKASTSFGWLSGDTAESAAMRNPSAAFESGESVFDSILGAITDGSREGSAGTSTDGFTTSSRLRGVWGSLLGGKK